ncbi:hypothetical protein THUN1379_12120 [Paludibacterium sp. THUN1379]|uniref:meta-pathway of phenol degradation family protein n=1 Tax=Paludibacterium sp. THUN1379 TaxID=3112107 RepID=UPI00308F0ECC|nr:hypothetical protein THUN1379_12120 [Paludibacterium sp. THUN1379]
MTSFLGGAVRAELPLAVEDLVTDKGKVKLELALTYANAQRHGLSTGEPVIIQTGPSSFLLLPSDVGEREGISDSLVSTVGLRYGWLANTELHVRASHLQSTLRERNDIGQTRSKHQDYFAEAWGGLTHQFIPDDDTPALLGFAEVALQERHASSSAAFKSWMVGLTTYKAIDPVVLAFSASYRLDLTRRDNMKSHKPGNLLLLHPSLAFAINDRVSVSGGVQWTNLQPDTLDGQAQGLRQTKSSLLFGVGYGASKQDTLNVSVKHNISGRGGAEMRFHWLYAL